LGFAIETNILDKIINLSFSFKFTLQQEVLRGRADYFSSFQQNADGFICSLLPGISHPQVQYSPGIFLSPFPF
jgi:hypothetical protein